MRVLPFLIISVTTVVAIEPNVHIIVEDDGADATEETNFQPKEQDKERTQVHEEGDDNEHEDKKVFNEEAADLVKKSPVGIDNVDAKGNASFVDEFHMNMEPFENELRKQLLEIIEKHDRNLANSTNDDMDIEPMMKTYLEIFNNSYSSDYEKRFDEAKKHHAKAESAEIDETEATETEAPEVQSVSKLQALRAGEEKKEEDRKEEERKKAEAKTKKLVQEHTNSQIDVKALKEMFASIDKEQLQQEAQQHLQQLEAQQQQFGLNTEAHLDKEELQQQFQKLEQHQRQYGLQLADEKPHEEGESLPAPERESEPGTLGPAVQLHAEMAADPDQVEESEVKPRSAKLETGQIRQHKAEKTEHQGLKKQIRSAEVDSSGNILSAVADPAVRAAPEDEQDDLRAVHASAPDVDQGEEQQTQSSKSTEDELALAKRNQYLSMAGLAVAVIVIAWMLIRRRAQQMIDHAEAFDDASSVSSTTMTEENPTVKVNRALLERMATISQKLSEKVEEARTTGGGSHSSSEYGNVCREKKNPQDS